MYTQCTTCLLCCCYKMSGDMSPPGSYTQNMPSRSAASGLPPILPPLLQQTVLNQDQPYVRVYAVVVSYMYALCLLSIGRSYFTATTKSCHFESPLCTFYQGTYMTLPPYLVSYYTCLCKATMLLG